MTCEICDDKHDSIDHVQETTPLEIIISETNPLDIILQEVNNNVKDVGGPDEMSEGGQGSGRNPEGPGDASGSQAGPLVTFETKLVKEMLDAKLNCPCNKNK